MVRTKCSRLDMCSEIAADGIGYMRDPCSQCPASAVVVHSWPSAGPATTKRSGRATRTVSPDADRAPSDTNGG